MPERQIAIVSDSEILASALEQNMTKNFASVARISSVSDLAEDPNWNATVFIVDAVDPKSTLDDLRKLHNQADLNRVVVLMRRHQTILDFREIVPFVGALMPNSTSLEEIVLAARILRPGLCLLPAGAALLLQSGPKHGSGRAASTKALTEREASVLGLLEEGASNKTIARRLGLSDSTVRVHVRAILKKLQLQNRTQAALYAVQSGSTQERQSNSRDLTRSA
jgi:two-component system nitrate/nitrite response regulator NarL